MTKFPGYLNIPLFIGQNCKLTNLEHNVFKTNKTAEMLIRPQHHCKLVHQVLVPSHNVKINSKP